MLLADSERSTGEEFLSHGISIDLGGGGRRLGFLLFSPNRVVWHLCEACV